jgi:hypothetical protein
MTGVFSFSILPLGLISFKQINCVASFNLPPFGVYINMMIIISRITLAPVLFVMFVGRARPNLFYFSIILLFYSYTRYCTLLIRGIWQG